MYEHGTMTDIRYDNEIFILPQQQILIQLLCIKGKTLYERKMMDFKSAIYLKKTCTDKLKPNHLCIVFTMSCCFSVFQLHCNSWLMHGFHCSLAPVFCDFLELWKGPQNIRLFEDFKKKRAGPLTF